MIARLLGTACLCSLGCIAPSVVASGGRSVEEVPGAEPAWGPARAEDFHGLFESVRIEGEAAAAVGKVYYHFSQDGSYAGAALVFGGDRPAFQTLGGRWSLTGDRLDLDDGVPVRAWVAADLLKLETPAGVAVLRRVPIE